MTLSDGVRKALPLPLPISSVMAQPYRGGPDGIDAKAFAHRMGAGGLKNWAKTCKISRLKF